MSESISAIVNQLAQDAERITLEVMDLPAMISTLVKYAAQRQVDPYVTLGVLVESIAHTISCSVPDNKQLEVAEAIIQLLLDRFNAQGLIRRTA